MHHNARVQTSPTGQKHTARHTWASPATPRHGRSHQAWASPPTTALRSSGVANGLVPSLGPSAGTASSEGIDGMDLVPVIQHVLSRLKALEEGGGGVRVAPGPSATESHSEVLRQLRAAQGRCDELSTSSAAMGTRLERRVAECERWAVRYSHTEEKAEGALRAAGKALANPALLAKVSTFAGQPGPYTEMYGVHIECLCQFVVSSMALCCASMSNATGGYSLACPLGRPFLTCALV